MENILIPTDFSNDAYNALFHAVQFMKGEVCTFHILNVFNGFTPLQDRTIGKEIAEQREDESREGLKRVCHRIRFEDKNPEHIFKTISKRGDLADIVSKVVEEKEIDLVIMGNTGRSEIDAIFMGSSALDVVNKVKKCPVLTIPKEIDFESPKDIALVTDYRRPYDAGLLHPLLFIAKRFAARIRIMHINEKEVLEKYQSINRRILMKHLAPFEPTHHWMPLFKSKAATIDLFLEDQEIDLLAMVNYEHSFLERMTREPVIQRVGFDNDIPFLVIPYK